MSDEELFKKGLFDELYLQMMPIIYKHINNKYLTLDTDDKIGRCNVVFSKAIRKFDADRGFKFTTYFVAALKRDYVNYMDRDVRRKIEAASIESMVYGDDKDLSLVDIISDGVDIEESVCEKFYINEISKSLTEDKKRILRLRLVGFTQKEIAVKIGLSRTSVYRRIGEIKKELPRGSQVKQSMKL